MSLKKVTFELIAITYSLYKKMAITSSRDILPLKRADVGFYSIMVLRGILILSTKTIK